MLLSDNEIIANILGGEKRRFAQLVDRYRDQVMTLAVRMLRNREEAEEAVQDAFIRAYNGLGKFEGSAKFSTWLYRIVYNVCLTRIERRPASAYSIEFDEERHYEIEEVAAFRRPDFDLESKDLIELVRDMIDRLPQHYRSVITLFYIQELSYAEICEVSCLPLGTVKAHLFRARSLLQRQLREKLEEEECSANVQTR
jgi:RNA polymerase sigma-70 factor (ECF subfamily)